MTRYELSRNYHHGIGMPEIIECADGRFVRWEDARRMREALQGLIRAYVNLMEAGRDRIIDLGGQCDPFDVMERSDPALRAARAALSQEQDK